MHEMSIVEALLDAIQRESRAYPAATVRSARVRVGQLRLIVPETMQFCFAAATRDTPLAGCRLELEVVQSTTPDLRTRKGGYIEADPVTLKTSKRGVFAAGDIVTGAATVILAMGAGRTAAKAIDEYLRTGAW